MEGHHEIKAVDGREKNRSEDENPERKKDKTDVTLFC